MEIRDAKCAGGIRMLGPSQKRELMSFDFDKWKTAILAPEATSENQLSIASGLTGPSTIEAEFEAMIDELNSDVDDIDDTSDSEASTTAGQASPQIVTFRPRSAIHRPTRPRPCLWSSKSYVACVVLRTPIRDRSELAPFVEQAIRRGVRLIAAVGPRSKIIEAAIDAIVVGDEFDPTRFTMTSSHQTLANAIRVIESYSGRKRFYEVWL